MIDRSLLYNGVTFTQEEAEACAAKWQERLRLQDWTVLVHIRRAYDLQFPDSQGENDWNMLRKLSAISLLDPTDWEATYIQAQDHELTLVHELLHMHFAMLYHYSDQGDDANMGQERAIIAIAETLVALSRMLDVKGGQDALRSQ